MPVFKFQFKTVCLHTKRSESTYLSLAVWLVLIVAIFRTRQAIWRDYFGIVPSRAKVGRKFVYGRRQLGGDTLLIFLNRISAMKYLKTIAIRLIREEDGPTAVEYAIMLALIVIVCVASVIAIGESARGVFEAVANGF